MSIRQLASELAAHPSQIGEWIKRGMPTEPGPARAWVSHNIRRRKYQTGVAGVCIFDLDDRAEDHADDEVDPHEVLRICREIIDDMDRAVAALPAALDARLATLPTKTRAVVQRAAREIVVGYAARRREGFLS